MAEEPELDLSQDDISEITGARTPLHVEIMQEGERFTYEIDETDKGIRLDTFLALVISDYSRSRLKEMIKAGNAMVNGKTITSPNHRLQPENQVALTVPPPEDPVPRGEDIPLAIIFEDDDLIVIDKPANMVVHPAAGNWAGTLVNALIHHCGDSLSGIGGVRRPGIVHRLDKETSGLLVVAKNDATHKGLSTQFADHGRNGPLRRAYQALVWNEPAHRKGTVHTELGRSANNRLKMAVVQSGGREAITHYDIIEAFGREDNDGVALASLITCHLETGRTHQIRVHMTHIGCPPIGDPVYGTGFQTKTARLPADVAAKVDNLKRQALHAFLLVFEHPRTGETLSFESKIPKDLATLVTSLRTI